MKFGSLPGFGHVIIFASSKALENGTAEGSDYISVPDVPKVVLEDVYGIPLEFHQVHKPFSLSIYLLIYVCHKVLIFLIAVSSTDGSRAWTLVSTYRSWFSSHRSWDVNRFSKQSPITSALSFLWYIIPKDTWTAVGAFGPSISISDFAIDHSAWDVTSQFPTFVSLRSSAFLRVISPMVLATPLTAVVHAGSRVTCRRFH
jgi:hypothetical protein